MQRACNTVIALVLDAFLIRDVIAMTLQYVAEAEEFLCMKSLLSETFAKKGKSRKQSLETRLHNKLQKNTLEFIECLSELASGRGRSIRVAYWCGTVFEIQGDWVRFEKPFGWHAQRMTFSTLANWERIVVDLMPPMFRVVEEIPQRGATSRKIWTIRRQRKNK